MFNRIAFSKISDHLECSPAFFLANRQRLVIVDEIQNDPELLSESRGEIDADRRRIYVRDSGLPLNLLGIREVNDLLGHPSKGASCEHVGVEKAYIVSPVETGWTVQQNVEVIGVVGIPHCLKQSDVITLLNLILLLCFVRTISYKRLSSMVKKESERASQNP